MTQRYFVESPIAAGPVWLVGDEAHHMLRVMRLQIGDSVRLFDGTGREYVAEICSVGRDRVELTIKSAEQVDRELPGELIVAVALPKGDRQRVLIEKLVELGVTAIVPLATSRSVAQFSDGVRTRLERIVIEASKQCGRNRLMQIAAPEKCSEFFAQNPSATKLITHPDGKSLRDVSWRAPCVVAIGPEGGFTTDEIESATKCGWECVNLGPRILRTETAAIFAAVIAADRISK